jgi:outer membrane protein OmpA-like peptidoglycan-associated protein
MLLIFIQDPNTQPGKDNWFNFNNLNFEFGTDKILPESISELENITRILKAYPNVKIKIGGYTDKLEDEATNLKISTKRAKAVFEALKQQGVGSQLEGAEGYGSQFAQFSATASEEDRKKDRRISISVRAK